MMRRNFLTGAAFLLALGLSPAFATEIPAAERRSDYDLMGPQTRAMQDDDTANPGMLSVLDGEALWNRPDGAAGKSCADCHGDARESMKGVAARYPAFSPALGRPIDLEARINMSRADDQKAAPLKYESEEMLGLTAYIALQSRGMAVNVGSDERLAPFIAEGRTLFNQRMGQINLSCAQCHDDNWGQKLAGAPIPQGHPNGYPVYRLEWQSLGSLQRRLRNCMFGMRAEPYPFGAPENVDLELYLMTRAAGLKMEAPAVRP
ncbi:MAG TPA: sulfur oxidation c-type cytochrome SoxA [Xanthobacteraceae bacterium]|nr:sulfur oxidation c-type cytochrome SoxA [Xanthobacteraceae bacterium]